MTVLRVLMVATVSIVTSAGSVLLAQEETGVDAIKVFLDCDFCDFDHFRREVTFVNYMRDRRDAQVHVLVTRQSTGGGREYTFHFIGLREFAGQEDTLRYQASSTDTEAETRDGLVHTFEMGLIPFVAGTPIGSRITISYEQPEVQQVATPEEDPWNFWVFRLRTGGSANGESQQTRWSVNGSVSADRLTEDWKIDSDLSGRFSRSVFDLGDGEEFVSTSKNFNGELLVVRSISDHWSVGGGIEGFSSTFTNRDLALSIRPAVEYSLFPYEESTRKQLIFLYQVGPFYFNYEEVTLFDKLEETRFRQSLEVAYEVTQPFGQVGVSIQGSHFLHDFALHRIDVRSDLSIRLVRGLNLNLFGSISRIKDQIHLPRADIPDEEILVQRRQLGTSFRYFVFWSLSYTFGSIFSNVVNPRMDEF
ncbi:MAG: hypothetical protein O7D29_12920 [Gemmatimonadetes bacterium]|nr:hypothetical protein [Gemmatimonadota bacterium]